MSTAVHGQERTRRQVLATPAPRPSPLAPIFLAGYPGDVGGANTEAWHTIKLWRSFGAPVVMLPTTEPDPVWRARLAALGIETRAPNPDPQIPRSTPLAPRPLVVSFCNSNFLRIAHRYQAAGCRIVWVNCMCWLGNEEVRHLGTGGGGRGTRVFDAYVFQSRYQQSRLAPKLIARGVPQERFHHIPGAFDPSDFPFTPSPPHPLTPSPFTVGRISRADPSKFSPGMWATFAKVRAAGVDLRVRVLGWDKHVQRKCGEPPSWAEVIPCGAMPAREFLAGCHALVQQNGGSDENWPRVGLEAFSSGVALVAEDAWGWREMVRHGRTGLLGAKPADLAAHLVTLATNENIRQRLIHQARLDLETRIANPSALWLRWQGLFASLAFSDCTTEGTTTCTSHGSAD